MGLLGFKLTGAVRSFPESCPGVVVPGRGAQAARQSVEAPDLIWMEIGSWEDSGQPRAVWGCGCPSSGYHGVGVDSASWTVGASFPLAETTCAATEFRCRDGTCIGNSSRCNQFIDCEDASDEMNCSECPAAAPGPSPALEMLLLSVLAAGTGVFGIWAGSGREEGPAPVVQPWDEAASAHPCIPPVPC